MIKNFFTFCFLFLSFQIFGQNIDQIRSIANFSNDSELSSYVEKAKLEGLSLNQVETLATAQGAKLSEIQLLRKIWNSKNDQLGDNFSKIESSIKSSFGNTDFEAAEEEEEEEELRFGSYFFNNKNISETPELFIATPSDYRLGPGDELIINLYGASENSYSVQISRNGTVKFDRLAPIYLSGLSI